MSNPLCVNTATLVEKIIRGTGISHVLAFDIGANIGGYFPMIAPRFDKVVAFEPVPDVFEKAHIRAEKEFKNVSVMPFAMGKDRGYKIVNVFNAWSLLPDDDKNDKALDYAGKPPFQINFVTLQDAVEWFGLPDFIKLDVDGYESDVIEGGKDFLKQFHPPIMFELSYLGRLCGHTETDSVERLFDLGYLLVTMDGKTVVSGIEELKPNFPYNTSFDVVMIHKTQKHLITI